MREKPELMMVADGPDSEHKVNGLPLPQYDMYEKEDEQEEPLRGPMRYVALIQQGIGRLIAKHQKHLQFLFLLALAVIFHVYLAFAIKYDWSRAETLSIFVAIIWAVLMYYLVKSQIGDRVYFNFYLTAETQAIRFWKLMPLRLSVYALVLGGIAAFLVTDTVNDRNRLMGLVGMACFITFMFIFSNNPAKINWRPVALGYLVQFILGMLVLRWSWGRTKFQQASDLIVGFIDYTQNGTVFVYGFLANPPNICGLSPVFAFSALQVIIYFGAIVSVLYYYGIMQTVLKKMAWAMQLTLGTTAAESLNACACIFLGQSEAPLLIRPYLSRMTASELHAIMTSGFSMIAGSLLAAYISFGACPQYLLSATVMSAPGSLACSKLLYPETEKSQMAKVEDLELPPSEESNALECISNGAVSAVEIVVAVIANLIVFLALLAFVDNVVNWGGQLLGYQDWTFELGVGYFFYPLAYVMGVNQNHAETLNVAKLMGTKTVLNEFIAYQKLGVMVTNHELSARAQMIATYALCGFSNFSSIGIQLGCLGGMCPEKKPLLSRLALRALMAGSISCFFTACLAGILIDEPNHCAPVGEDGTCFDVSAFQALLNNLTNTTTATATVTSITGSMFR